MNTIDQHAIIFILVIVSSLTGMIYDLKERRIPNKLTFPILISGLAIHFLYGGLNGALLSLAAAFIGGAVLFVFHLMGGMGAGDVKFMAAVGAILGIEKVLTVLLLTAFLGGILAVGQIIICRAWKPVLSNIALIARGIITKTVVRPEHLEKHGASGGIPYGVAIGLAAICTLFLQAQI